MTWAGARPKVSVLVLAYNHERYLGQALDSALGQVASFPVEIVVGEDCSTDGTRELLLAYANAHPTRIRPLLRERNLGMIGNLVDTYRECRGEYTALLEGDDYWTAEDKLETQVRFLEENPGCSACFHNATAVREDGAAPPTPVLTGPTKEVCTLADVVSRFFIPTMSVLFRSGLVQEFPPWFATMPMGDWPLHVLHAERGDFGYIDRTMAVYRIHAGGVWSGAARERLLSKTLAAIDAVDEHLGFRYRAELGRLRAETEHKLARELIRSKAYGEALHYAARAALRQPFRFTYVRDLARAAALRLTRD